MSDFIADYINDFLVNTRLSLRIENYNEFLFLVVLILGVLLCFFGFKLYRIFLSIIIFMSITIEICISLKWDFSGKAVCFVLLGCLASLIVFQFKKLDIYILSGIICATLTAVAMPSIIMIFIMWGIGFLIATIYPEYSLYVLTSIIGGLTIASIYHSVYLLIFLVILGVAFQYFIDRQEVNR